MEVIYCLLLTYWVPKEQFSVLARFFWSSLWRKRSRNGLFLHRGTLGLKLMLSLSLFVCLMLRAWLPWPSLQSDSPRLSPLLELDLPLSFAAPLPQNPWNPSPPSQDGFWAPCAVVKTVRNANDVDGCRLQALRFALVLLPWRWCCCRACSSCVTFDSPLFSP